MASRVLPSIFNDVIGPVMRGPSSSHSAAAVRIGLLLHDLCAGRPDRVSITYDTQGSLATTHHSQGTDMGLYGGLLGFVADDERLPDAPEMIRAAGTVIELTKDRLDDPHPNTYRIALSKDASVSDDELSNGELGESGPNEVRHDVVALSTGGGMIEVIEIDGFPVSLFGDTETTLALCLNQSTAEQLVDGLRSGGTSLLEGLIDANVVAGSDSALVVIRSEKRLDDATLALPGFTAADVVALHQLRRVLPIPTGVSTSVPFHHASQMPNADELSSRPLSDWAVEYEVARSGLSTSEVLAYANDMLAVMRGSIEAGLSGTDYGDRILGPQVQQFQAKRAKGELLDGGLLNDMIANVTALMEAKSAMEVIVAAPTAGACATFPGALVAGIDAVDVSGEAAARAVLTGGLIGVFVANRSSFAAEVGGCQAETGAGAAMAAAALVELGGGSAAQSLSAASQSLQNVLGLICDPVANRVEAPCLGRNVSGAANALSCANMALAGYDHLIPFDEVLDAHRQVSELMARELRCTGLGGLAVTPTAQKIELSLKPSL